MRAAYGCRRLPRLGAFGTVAALGFAVQVTTIVVLTAAGWHLAWATAAGVSMAVLHNFIWHERWTWRDRAPLGTVGRRLVRVVLSTGLVSLVGTVALTALYVAVLGAPVLIGNLLAVWSVGLLNYTVLDRLIYRT
jgi:putative flippase GtrA